MKRLISNFWHDSRGQDLVEYALAVGMAAMAAVAAMPGLTAVMINVCDKIDGIIQNNVH